MQHLTIGAAHDNQLWYSHPLFLSITGALRPVVCIDGWQDRTDRLVVTYRETDGTNQIRICTRSEYVFANILFMPIQFVLLVQLALKSLVPVPLPAPRVPLLPAPKVAGLLPAPSKPSPYAHLRPNVRQRLETEDAEIIARVQAKVAQVQASFQYKPLFP